jgi:hypothetical protein
MAAPKLSVPHVTIELDRPRRMTLTLGATRRIEDATGMEFPQVMEALLEGKVFSLFAPVIWAGLAGEDPDLTLAQVEEMIPAGAVQPLMEPLDDLFARTFPDLVAAAEGAGPLDSPKPKRPTNRAKGKKPSA